MIILKIDTTDNKKTHLILKKDNREFKSTQEYDTPKADEILKEIDNLLKQTNTEKTEIGKIIVHRGPGSYTGIRVGITIANTLAFALQIPVNDKKTGEYETALYK